MDDVLAKKEWNEFEESKLAFKEAERLYREAERVWQKTHMDMSAANRAWLAAELAELNSRAANKLIKESLEDGYDDNEFSAP